jgi:23S rRNA (cytosine1962-C5)-methyltransferase
MDIDFNKYWKDYQLIDCGNKLKLEKFGNIITIRPDITANQSPKLNIDEWKKLADAEFCSTNNHVNGEWILKKNTLKKWKLSYNNLNISLLLQFTSTKHLGIFPEQILNWQYLSEKENFSNNKFLNLFGYTGVSSLVAAKSGMEVTHIDSVKKIVEWGKLNMSLSDISNIRWIVEDAQKFVEKEIRRKNKYTGIILDPPAIGKGPKKETWILEKSLEKLLQNINKILAQKSFIILNLYSHSINTKYVHKIILKYFPSYKIEFCDEVIGLSKYGNTINHGFLVRLERF